MVRQKNAQPPTDWEVAKPILRKDYLEGRVIDSMKPKDVWEMRPEFKSVKYENFRNNFARLKRTIKEHQNRAEIDEAGYLHDMAIYKLAKDTAGCWDGSDAQQLLQTDINNEQHKQMKPELLWLSRSEYRQFDLKKFRGHIHQELRRERETNYWIVKKKKKMNAEAARKAGKRLNDDDMDFLFDPVLNM